MGIENAGFEKLPTLKAAQEFVDDMFKELDSSGRLEEMGEEELLEFIAAKAEEHALESIAYQFENPDNPEQQLAFHGTGHTEGVIDRTKRLGEAVERARPGILSFKAQVLLRVTAAMHDYQHIFNDIAVESPIEGAERRARVGGGYGEGASAYEAVDYLTSVNRALEARNKNPLFSDDDLQDVSDSINVTIPGIVNGVLVQPNLKPETELSARIVALADLGEFGMNGPDALWKAGKQVAIEENSDIEQALLHEDVTPITDVQKIAYTKRLLGALKFQESLAISRKNLQSQELAGITDEAVKNAIIDQFPYLKDENFKGVLEDIRTRIQEAEGKDFDALVEEIGFKRAIPRLQAA